MRIWLGVLGIVVLAVGLMAWRSQLFTVERASARPESLRAIGADARRTTRFDATLAAVPIGSQRLRAGDGLIVVHYWAPWERHSGDQSRGLDSLRRTLPPGALTLALVCFDPYPSVARYATRLRLQVPILLDLRRTLADQLACPSIPYTYVIDARGRIAVEQGGEVDWLSPGTRQTLLDLAAEPAAPEMPSQPPAPPARTGT